jgi:hypothetical protein
MLEYPFKVRKASNGQNTTFAVELLAAAACSDDAHRTDYFNSLLMQHLLKARP